MDRAAGAPEAVAPSQEARLLAIDARGAHAEDQGTVDRLVEESVAEMPNALKVVAAILCIAWAVFWFTLGWFIVPILNVMLGAVGLALVALATRYKKPISPEDR